LDIGYFDTVIFGLTFSILKRWQDFIGKDQKEQRMTAFCQKNPASVSRLRFCFFPKRELLILILNSHVTQAAEPQNICRNK
jgi:hypothetical protein